MRLWMPEWMYRSFPFAAGAAGVLGCLVQTPATIGLGGVLLLYSGSVIIMRW